MLIHLHLLDRSMYEDIILILKSKNKTVFCFSVHQVRLRKIYKCYSTNRTHVFDSSSIYEQCSFSFVGGRRTHRIRTVTVSTYVFGTDSQSVHFRLQNFGAIPQQCKAYLVFLDYMCPSKKLIS